MGILTGVVSDNVAGAVAKAAIAAYREASQSEDKNGGTGTDVDMEGGAEVSPAKEDVAVTMGSAAVKSQILLEREDAGIEELVAQLVDKHLSKLEEKMSHFDDLERIVEKQRRQLDADRKELNAQRIQLQTERTAFEAERSAAKESEQ